MLTLPEVLLIVHKVVFTTVTALSQLALIQASAVLAMAVPVVIFFLAQKAFMRGVVVTGVDK